MSCRISLDSLFDVLPSVLRAHAKKLELQVTELRSRIQEMRSTIRRLEDALASVRPSGNQDGAIIFNPPPSPIPHTLDVEGVVNPIDSFYVHSDGAEMHHGLVVPEVCYPMVLSAC